MPKHRWEGVEWDQPPPEDRDPYIPILSPKPLSSVSGIILTPRMVGVYTHHMHGRTRPCVGEAHGCPGCLNKLPRRWKGYFGGYEPRHARKVLLELTHGAALSKIGLLKRGEINFRGWKCTLTRAKGANNAPVTLELEPCPTGDRGLPEAFDVQLALTRIWEGRRPSTWDGSELPFDSAEDGK